MWHNQVYAYMRILHQELDDFERENVAKLHKQKVEFNEMIEKLDEMKKKSTTLQKSKNVLEMQVFKSLIETQETTKEFSQYMYPAFHALKTKIIFSKTILDTLITCKN